MGDPSSNGARPPRREVWAARQIAGRLPGKLEALVAVAVFGGVFGVAWLIFSFPGPLVVQVREDGGRPVVEARVRCWSDETGKSYSGLTDVFGEAKWPGLTRGPWRCEMTPPVRYYGERQEGGAVVVPRAMSSMLFRVERPAHLMVTVKRPKGAPRAWAAVRAWCPPERGLAEESWEARAGLIDGLARVWLPHGRTCRVGLVRPELPRSLAGPVPHPALDCAKLPCTAELSGGVGGDLSADLAPTLEQWMEARPPPEPDPVPPGVDATDGGPVALDAGIGAPPAQ